MPLSFPLSAADFADLLCVRSVEFDDPESIEISTSGAGELMAAELAPRLWQGSVDIHDLGAEKAGMIKARIGALRTPGRAFFIYNHRRKYPFFDPDGTKFGAATPVINSLNVDNRQLSISGMPANYELRAGDLISFAYDSSSLYAMHRIVDASVVASGAGLTPEFEVTPNIRPGAVVSEPVQIIKPICKAVMVPGSFNSGNERKKWVFGMSFSWRQTLL